MVTKAVSDALSPGHGGIADQTIRFGGMPCLEKEDLAINKSGLLAGVLAELTSQYTKSCASRSSRFRRRACGSTSSVRRRACSAI